MKRISTTIKRVWMDKILSGEKTSEFKGATPFWDKRLKPLLYCGEEIIITFLCGKQPYWFRVRNVFYYDHPRTINGTEHRAFYEIALGEQIDDMELEDM